MCRIQMSCFSLGKFLRPYQKLVPDLLLSTNQNAATANDHLQNRGLGTLPLKFDCISIFLLAFKQHATYHVKITPITPITPITLITPLC